MGKLVEQTFKNMFYLSMVALGSLTSSWGEQGLFFVAACKLHCGRFSCSRAQALGTRSLGTFGARAQYFEALRALGLQLSSCGTQSYLDPGMWKPWTKDCPVPGIGRQIFIHCDHQEVLNKYRRAEKARLELAQRQ